MADGADRGALVFYSAVDDPDAWRKALAAELPGLDFRVHPETGDPAAVRYALVWQPPANFFAPFANLSLVVNLGAGVDALLGRDDLPAVPISRLSDPGMVALMTSYVLFAAIRYARDIPIFERAQRQRQWRYVHPRPLSAIRVGVLGLGQLGAAAAEALVGAGFDVSGWARTPKTIRGVRCLAGPDRFEEFLADSEILVVLLPLTPQTRGLIGERVFALLPAGARLINVSRGHVVDETALLDALRAGRLSEATLDVFAVEPLPAAHPFWTMDNVLITPHLASIAVPEAAAGDVAESVRRVASGAPPLHLVDRTQGY